MGSPTGQLGGTHRNRGSNIPTPRHHWYPRHSRWITLNAFNVRFLRQLYSRQLRVTCTLMNRGVVSHRARQFHTCLFINNRGVFNGQESWDPSQRIWKRPTTSSLCFLWLIQHWQGLDNERWIGYQGLIDEKRSAQRETIFQREEDSLRGWPLQPCLNLPIRLLETKTFQETAHITETTFQE